MTKPSKASCPNRYTTSVVAPAPTPGPSQQSSSGYLRKEEVADFARILPETAPRVLFEVAETQGDEYRRLIEPMPQYIAEASICASSQVSIHISDRSASDDEYHMRFILTCFYSQVTPYWWLT